MAGLPASQRRRHPIGKDPERERRHEEAVERQEAYKARSVEDQLALIASRPGKSKKEVAKLRRKK